MHRIRTTIIINFWKLYDHKAENKYDYNIWKLYDHKAAKYDVLTNDNMKRSLKDRIYHRRIKEDIILKHMKQRDTEEKKKQLQTSKQ